MSSTDREKQTIRYYDREAENWVAASGGGDRESYLKAEMARFKELLPRGKVLEIGSGAGKDASALISLGYDYTGTDASEGLLNIAQKRNPMAKFYKMAVHDLSFPDQEFDGFWTAATLLHIPKAGVGEALKSIGRVVKSGGIGFISMKAGAGEREDASTGRWFAYYSQDGFHKILEENGYSVIQEDTRKGEKDWWLVYFVKKQ